MWNRIVFSIVRLGAGCSQHRKMLLMLSGLTLISFRSSSGQSPGYLVDPMTKTVYQEQNTVTERPVYGQRTVNRQQTVYTPQTVTVTSPTTHTSWQPVTSGSWKPYLANRWNPFVAPSIAYRYDIQTTWEPRSQVVHHTTTRNEYVKQTQTVPVTEMTKTIVRDQKNELVAVGRLVSDNQDLRSRLQPIARTERIEFNRSPASFNQLPNSNTRIATGRSAGQQGQRTTDLTNQSARY